MNQSDLQPMTTTAAWLRHKAEYGSSLGMTAVRDAVERGDVGDALRALADIAERESRRAF